MVEVPVPTAPDALASTATQQEDNAAVFVEDAEHTLSAATAQQPPATQPQQLGEQQLKSNAGANRSGASQVQPPAASPQVVQSASSSAAPAVTGKSNSSAKAPATSISSSKILYMHA